MASKDTSTHTTKLKSTLDDIQKRFSCGRDELCIWRNSLCYRYSAITNNELSVEINDYDINDSVLGGNPLIVPLPTPSELSKTSKDTSTHTTKLKSTLDDIQKRFSCGRDELCIWRNSLCYRYSAITNNELSVEINDYDINDSVLGGNPLIVPLPTPSELSKTVIRIYCEKAKSITLTTLFYSSSHWYFTLPGQRLRSLGFR